MPRELMADTFSEVNGFVISPHGLKDMVEASAFNSYGTRFALGSADGKIKVFDRLRNGTWILCDTWGAHNAEILEIHWLPPTLHPNLLASISTDQKFRLWAEDPSLAPLSGRRFSRSRPIFELRSPPRSPFLSFSLKHAPELRTTYLALLDRSATLTVYENDEPEDLTSWTPVDSFQVCEKPAQGDEVSFRVDFDHNLEPCYAAIREGVPRDGLGVVVAGMHTARIWRSKVITHDVSLGSGSSREFYRAADLGDQRALVRDVAWAKGSIRGYDICATACKDGLVRVFEVHTPGPEGERERSGALGEIKTPGVLFGDYPPSSSSHTPHRSESHSYNNSLSGISASLASARGSSRGEGTNQVRHVVREVARLDGHGGPVWRVKFDDDGLVLGSTGDDGRVRLWRRRPDGSWGASGELGISRVMPTG